MKYIQFTCALLSILLFLGACNQETPEKKEKPVGAPKTESEQKQAADEGVVALLKSSLQGRWKASAEPGVEYEIKDGTCIRYENGKPGPSLSVKYALYPDLTCGAMNKKYREVIACVMLRGQDDVCLAVQGFTSQRFDFVKMGDPNGVPESWTK